MLRSTLILLSASGALCASIAASPLADIGCFSHNSETLSHFINNGSFTFQSTGYCQNACGGMGHSYIALKGNYCWCGDAIPPISDMIVDSNCNITCAGFAEENCGGSRAFEVYASEDTPAIESVVSSYSDANTALVTVAASESTTLPVSATAISSESSSSSAPGSSATTSAAASIAATTTKASSSAAMIPSATATSTSVHTGAAVAVDVQVGLGLMAGLMAVLPML